MTTTTPYLGLTLYDSSGDQAVTFATFRAVWGGPASTSNFYKIDTAISNQASQIATLQLTKGSVSVTALYQSPNTYAAVGVSGISAYNTGMTIILSVDTTTNGTVTLNINSLGVKSCMKVNSSGTAINLTGSDLVKGRQYLFVYDGTRWLWVSSNSADQIQIVGTAGNVVTVGSDNSLDGSLTQSLLLSQTIHAATSKATPVDADEIDLIDSAASNVLKKLTWANLKATLKTYLDTLYAPDGWLPSGATWTYSSADSPTFVASVNADVTGLIGVGDRFSCVQTTTKYFIVTAVGAYSGGATLITLYGGTDYTLANAAITSPKFSHMKNPFGFPTDPSKWTVLVSYSSDTTKTSPTPGTWYGGALLSVSGPTITIPIGLWFVRWQAAIICVLTTGTNPIIYGTLSTANNTESDNGLTAAAGMVAASSGAWQSFCDVTRSKQLSLAAKTTYYMNIKTSVAAGNITIYGATVHPAIFEAVCAYL